MNRQEFEEVRNNPNKTIAQDIAFRPKVRGAKTLEFRDVAILTPDFPGLNLILNGNYNPTLNKVTFNVQVKGAGPVCRIDVNGTNHGDAGRTHKHSLQRPEDCQPPNNIPYAVPRPELEGLTPEQVFDAFCQQANIKFTGQFQVQQGL